MFKFFEWITNFFTSLWHIVSALIGFIIDAFTSILMLIRMIPEYLGYLGNMIAILPAWIIVFLTGIIAITVIWTIRRAI